MKLFLVIFCIVAAAVLLFFTAAYVCFYLAFYSPKRKPIGEDEYPLPDGEIYLPFKEKMVDWMKQVRNMPCEEVSVRSFDGLTLRGRFYCFSPDAPIEIMFPGYRGDAERDLCGGVQRCFSLGHSALVVDHRACGRSDGKVISFGVNECKDCHSWIEFVNNSLGADKKIILTGISMGAATVVMAAGGELPKNVIGVLADCGYSSAKDIIKKVIADLKLPPSILYPLVRLSGRIFGGFDVEKACPKESAKKIKLPLILFHGEADAFVPSYMSEEIYESCNSRKKLIKIENAGHGLAYVIEPKRYLCELDLFWKE